MKKLMIGILAVLCVSMVLATCPSPQTCAKLISDMNAACTSNYDLTCDLNCAGETGLTPICTGGYTGIFDGQNHTITGLTIYQSGATGVGLFGYTKIGAVIKNVGLVNVNITGNLQVGGLVGNNYGSVSNSYATGTVTGTSYVGGLVGDIENGGVSNSYATGIVTGTGSNSYVGGLVGQNQGGSVSNSYATGQVTGINYVGGLVGYNWGSVSNSYATGTVTGTGTFYIGGLIGRNRGGSVSNSYWFNNVQVCCGSSSCSCSPANDESDFYFKTYDVYYDYDEESPVWDFDNIWKETSTYPVFQWQQTGPVCGNGNVETGEQCELPSTSNNNNCSQSAQQCAGSKTQTRDSYGDCNVTCGCVYDDWGTAQCIISSCGAQCDDNTDCNDGNPKTTDTCNLDTCSCSYEQQGGAVPEINKNNITMLTAILIAVIALLVGAVIIKRK